MTFSQCKPEIFQEDYSEALNYKFNVALDMNADFDDQEEAIANILTEMPNHKSR